MKLTETYQRILILILKLTIAAATLGYIAYKLFFDNQIQELVGYYSFQWTNQKVQWLALTTLLVVPNLLLEGLKWKILMKHHEKISWIQSLQSVSAGIALGIITPNRIGEFTGKALFLKNYDKIKGALVSAVGSIAQALVMLIYGGFGIWVLAYQQQVVNQGLFQMGLIGIVIVSALICFLFLNIHWLTNLIRWKKISTYVDAVTHYSAGELSTLLLLSGVRTVVFNIQYFLLLQCFDVHIDALHAFPALAAILFTQLIVPSIMLVEVGVRGATALFFLSLFSPHSQGILMATYSLWIINIMLPGLIGLFFILKLKWRTVS